MSKTKRALAAAALTVVAATPATAAATPASAHMGDCTISACPGLAQPLAPLPSVGIGPRVGVEHPWIVSSDTQFLTALVSAALATWRGGGHHNEAFLAA